MGSSKKGSKKQKKGAAAATGGSSSTGDAAEVDPIEACKEACKVQSVCSSLQEAAIAADITPKTSSQRGLVLSCADKIPQLLLALLSARERPREWKQAEYSSRVCALLDTAATILDLTGVYQTGTLDTLSASLLLQTTHCLAKSELLWQTDTAQQEVCQLLLSSLQQQQQQQDGCKQLQELAFFLLSWWLGAQIVWVGGTDYSAGGPYGPAAFQQAAVELAVALAQSLQPGSLPEFGRVIARVAYRIYSWPLYGSVPVVAARQRLMEQRPAFLQLSLAVLLVHCSELWTAQRSSDSDSGGVLPQSPAIADLWQAAGFPPGVLPAMVENVRPLLPLLLQHCSKSVYRQLPEHMPADLRGFVVTAQAVGQSLTEAIQVDNDSLDPYSSAQPWAICPFDQMSRQKQQLLQACVWALPTCVLQTARWFPSATGLVILAAVAAAAPALQCWTVPGLYDAAAAAAQRHTAMHMHDKQTGAAGSTAVKSLPELMQPVLDCWLLLMRQLLLQQTSGLPCQAAAATKCLQQETSITPCSCSSFGGREGVRASPGDQEVAASPNQQGVLLHCGALDELSSMVKVLMALVLSSDGVARITQQDTRQLQQFWCNMGLAVMLVLEMVIRQLLPVHILCSSDSTDDSNNTRSSSSSTARVTAPVVRGSSAAAYLHTCIADCMGIPQDGMPFLQVVCLKGSDCIIIPPNVPKQQVRLLHGQLYALCASSFKAYRCRDVSADSVAIANGIAYSIVTELREVLFSLCTTSNRCAYSSHAVLAPRLVLLGLYQHQAGTWCKDWSARMPVDDDEASEWISEELTEVQELVDGVSRVRASLVDACRTWGAPKAVSSSGSDKQPAGAAAVLGASGSSSGSSPPAAAGSAAEASSSCSSEQRGSTDAGSARAACEPLASSCTAGLDAWDPWYSANWLQEEQLLLTGEVAEVVAASYDVVETAVFRMSYLCSDEADGSCDSSDGSLSDDSEEREDESVAHGFSGAELARMTRRINRCQSPSSCWGEVTSCRPFTRLPGVLQAAGTTLCNKLPVPWMCNNLGCTNMAGVSELQLVGGSSCVCGGCKVARYCSQACAAAHWQQHKPVCRELAAAAAAVEALQAAPAADLTMTVS